jgi:peptidyl-prolyl cis-trans isomerase SurA
MNRLFACLLAVAAVFTTTQAIAQQLQPVDRIVAVVDEDVILRSELDRALQNVLSQYATRQDQLPPRDVLEKQVLERLVLLRLQVARAASSGITVSDQEVADMYHYLFSTKPSPAAKDIPLLRDF